MFRAAAFLILAIALAFAANGLGQHTFGLYKQGEASEDWVPVLAEVNQFELNRSGGVNRKGGPDNPDFLVQYQYVVEGAQYSGDRLSFGPYANGQLIRPDRGQATVYYDPDQPSQSVYIRGVSQANFYALLLAVGLAFAALISGIAGVVRLFKSMR